MKTKTKTLITAIITVAVLLSTTDWSMAHSQRHAGGHSDAQAGDCLKPIRQKGMMGVGSWENSCSYGVHVKWRIESDERGTGCTSRPGSHYPCLWYVGPNTRVTATMSDNSGHGSVYWIACRAEDFASDPWPVITKIKPDGSVNFNCFHMGYGPRDDGASKSELEKALRQNHGWMTVSLHQYKERQLERINRAQKQARQKREKEEYLAAQERLRWEEEQFQWEQEQRQRELRRAQSSGFLKQFNDLANSMGQRSSEAYSAILEEQARAARERLRLEEEQRAQERRRAQEEQARAAAWAAQERLRLEEEQRARERREREWERRQAENVYPRFEEPTRRRNSAPCRDPELSCAGWDEECRARKRGLPLCR